ncbi:MAG: biotin--[acetyl-CoA-carboxylase] ligase [Bacteroidales bacterium]|nr:biotin--[acetyl-CoA-carboxylase] ligase [Bacteroidales bacterium]MBD5208640.1 biotin--[acetyl-CoA-carboxylase] ligase [Bacteroidales bacterium]
MFYIDIEETDSTNKYLAEIASDFPSMTMVSAVSQTAGRGQRGNGWESFPGENITASLLFRPKNIRPTEQFLISQSTALAVVDTLNHFGINAQVKWPNDIYIGNYKICGILIENSLSSASIIHSIIGIGLNVNQIGFSPEIPNAVSMIHFLERRTPLLEVKGVLSDMLVKNLLSADTSDGAERIKSDYKAALWRGDGKYHPFRDTKTDELFDAKIVDIEPAGPIILETNSGEQRHYWFKEVQFLPDKDALAKKIRKYGGGF